MNRYCNSLLIHQPLFQIIHVLKAVRKFLFQEFRTDRAPSINLALFITSLRRGILCNPHGLHMYPKHPSYGLCFLSVCAKCTKFTNQWIVINWNFTSLNNSRVTTGHFHCSDQVHGIHWVFQYSVNKRLGSSAYTLHSMAHPLILTSSCLIVKVSPQQPGSFVPPNQGL